MDAGFPQREDTGEESRPGRRRRAGAAPKESPARQDRISRRTAARTRRAITFLLGLWCGGMALVAPASFRAANTVMKAAPPALQTVIEKTDAATAQALLRYQVGEVNRLMFGLWGWTQAAAALAVLLLLVFLSNAGRAAVGVSALMLLVAALMHFVLIPRIAMLTRTAGSAPGKTAGSSPEMFALLHGGFAVFQLALLGLIGVLLFLLFRSRDRDGGGI